MPHADEQLRSIRTFEDLIHYLEEELDWPLQEYGFDELTFEYQPEELGLKEDDAAKVKTIHQLRPLQHGQPWGIFFVEFENKKLPVVVLRRILSHLVVKKRASANKAGEAAWHAEDLMFITTFGEDDNVQREIAFAHFHQPAGDLPTLHVLGWDGDDTPLKLAHLDSDLHQYLRWPDNVTDHRAWRQQWTMPFRHRIGHVIRTADVLAEVLAALARGINKKATRMLAAESENGPLRKLYKSFQVALIHDLTESSFADTYAQTITYGLLTAAISRTDWSEGRHGTFIIAENVSDMVPITNPFLKEMLQTFLNVGGRKGGIDFDELGIQDVVELLRGDETDLPAILRDFGNRTPGEDPVIHFYEHFLSAYNKKLKIQRGVFYTPQPVVSYIIRSVHELLQTEFGLEDGLASTMTWEEMKQRNHEMTIPDGTSPESPFIMILDIATGTGTFLVEVIDVINKTMKAKWQKQGKREHEIVTLWNEYVPKHLLPRLYGYELMMAPYAIAHMKIGLKLSETGYKFMSDERVRVYLTNTLELASDVQQKFVGILPALAHEAEAVNAIKRNVRFTVLVGNPPYAGNSANISRDSEGVFTFIGRLIDDYKQVDGHSLGERQSKWLQDDYVKFIRFAEFLTLCTGCGIVGFITNHSYLDNPTFRGMRQHLMKIFSRVWTYDLHGNTTKKETPPPGIEDVNVFDIQQGVAIFFGVRRAKNFSPSFVEFAEIWGIRDKKYSILTNESVRYTNWINLAPSATFYLFIPQNINLRSEYNQAWSIKDIMPTFNVGFVTARDEFVVDFEAKPIRERIELFRKTESEISNAEIQIKFGLKDTTSWNLKEARAALRRDSSWEKTLIKCLYRAFDVRYICYSLDLLERPVYQIQRHLLSGKNLGLLTSRQVVDSFRHVFATTIITNFNTLATAGRLGSGPVFPLYLDDRDNGYQLKGLSAVRVPNLGADFLRHLSENLGLTQISKHGLPTSLTPEDIFHYIYAIFHCPIYRTRYSEFLKGDFPRVPLTSSLGLFRALGKLGTELVALHLLESPKVNEFITRFAGKGDNVIPKKPTWKDNAVWINPTQRFEGVPENVWNFHIGGYQVCEKWLKDRKGRTLSADDITHYQRIVVALNETIRIMAEIDRVIDEHGGWPIK